MAGSSAQLHEAHDRLGPEIVDRHRAIVSLMEELEAIDWYDQRIAASDDPDLAAVLAHNRDEEKEHAVMLLEWLRRRDPALDRQLRTYLFTSEPVADLAARSEDDPASPTDTSLGLGSLRAKDDL
jgi:ferritin-like protein